ncbi:MAG: prepilin-type N-terminal cleavage/methylation domain-containing protein [Verrucomicrobiota bacterium]
MRRKLRNGKAGYTLVELMIGMAVTSGIFAALMSGVVCLQRSYQAAIYYAEALSDQTRALDYIVRDARGALNVSISEDQKVLTLTLADYYTSYDEQGNATGSVRAPVITNNVVTHANPSKPRTIRYFVSNRSLVREVFIANTETTGRTVIANDVDNFEFTFGVLDSTVTANLTFSPRFKGISQITDQNTKRSAHIYMRNHKSI